MVKDDQFSFAGFDIVQLVAAMLEVSLSEENSVFDISIRVSKCWIDDMLNHRRRSGVVYTRFGAIFYDTSGEER